MLETKTASIVKNQYGEKVIQMKFPYDLNILFNIRSLPGRKWHTKEKCWTAPFFPKTINSLKKWGFIFDEKLQTFLLKSEIHTNKIVDIGIKGLQGKLYPFQRVGVAFIESNKGRVLLADEMGLGKTIQALAWLQLHPDLRPAIIVVPASLKLNWAKETSIWMSNPNIEILSGTRPWKIAGDIVIINYDILRDWIYPLQKIKAQVLITDECHLYKSNSAQRTKAVKRIAKGINHVIALSGTPIVNRPIEVFNALKIIDPNLFPDYWYFVKHFCNAKHNGFGWDFSGASHTDELHNLLTSTVMIRRLKKDVLPELPSKAFSFVPIQLHNPKEYEAAERDFIGYITETKGKVVADRMSNAEVLSQIEVLKQLAVKEKLPEAIEWIENFLESGEKLVVFANHRFVIDTLMEKFSHIDKTRKLIDRVVKIDGSVSLTERQKAVSTFQTNPDCRLFIGNIKAAGVGITLTASSNVAFLELPWTPGDLTQAEDRCHRIGQKDSVNIHYLLAVDTIEEKIAKLLDNKRKVLDAVLDGKETEQESLLSELLKEYI
jgi:SWI/SNF-related matrix-associated actin-dependent regulator of chromatin subfamily A-like protein 1